MSEPEKLDDFEVRPDGSVTLHSGDPDGYATKIRLTAAEVITIAEASAAAYGSRLVGCQRCRIARPAYEINTYGICVTCVKGR